MRTATCSGRRTADDQSAIGILHPGRWASRRRLGAGGGSRVLWASEGRSAQTRSEPPRRLEDADARAVCAASGVILSSAAAFALTLRASRGPALLRPLRRRQRRVPGDSRESRIVEGAGATFVDGGIIGPPARTQVPRACISRAPSGRPPACSPRAPRAITVMADPRASASRGYAAYTKVRRAPRELRAGDSCRRGPGAAGRWARSQGDLAPVPSARPARPRGRPGDSRAKWRRSRRRSMTPAFPTASFGPRGRSTNPSPATRTRPACRRWRRSRKPWRVGLAADRRGGRDDAHGPHAGSGDRLRGARRSEGLPGRASSRISRAGPGTR